MTYCTTVVRKDFTNQRHRVKGMKQIVQWLNNSKYTEPLSPGCKLCAKGAKLVLLVTGKCSTHCFYCPLSKKKYGKDVVYADEWKLDDENDVDNLLKEAGYIEARGAGLTGGDPLLVWKRTKQYISLLKEHFGEDFHIHLYTSGLEEGEHIPDLVAAGLDEIRFHPPPRFWNDMGHSPIKKPVHIALKEDVDVAVEIPSIPKMENEMFSLIRWADEQGIRWVNLNELEFSETNCTELIKRGYDVKNDISAAAKGSEETAYNLLDAVSQESLDIGVHYCSSSFKDGVQLRNRIKRRARNIAKPYEVITDEGTLLKGVIISESTSPSLTQTLKQRFNIPTELILFDKEKKRVELAGWILEEIAPELVKQGFECYLVEEYPTADRLEVERMPLM